MAIIEKLTNTISIETYVQNTNLQIPAFQRPYKWTEKNVIQLLDDIKLYAKKSEKEEIFPYRIGTVVVHKWTNEKNQEILDIVDGQQRTITFLLMIKALRQSDSDEILSLVNFSTFQPSFANDISKSNIKQNFETIKRKIIDFNKDTVEYFLKQCEVTFIVLDDISEAFQFFDSQNSRGKDLDPHDLLKAYHLREMSDSPTEQTERVVATWEATQTDDLRDLFAEFLFRIKGWLKGDSSMYFTKNDIGLFKGINLNATETEKRPYTQIYEYAHKYISEKNNLPFPFQLDQMILNGKLFFEMAAHYLEQIDKLKQNLETKLSLDTTTTIIINKLNTYDKRNRTGDKYTRMLFDCALLFYVDKFGYDNINKAVEVIFIWAYSLRLNYQSLQLNSVDKYVLSEKNLFKEIKEFTDPHDIDKVVIKPVEYIQKNSPDIKDLFITLKYID